MIAGQLAALEEPLEDRLESFYRRTPERALDVDTTQEGFDGRPVQDGTAVTTVEDTQTSVAFLAAPDDSDGEYSGVDVEREDTARVVATEWVADPQGTGLLAAESTTEAGAPVPFPFDMIEARTGREVRLLEVNIQELYESWRRRDDLAEVWLKGVEDDGGDDDSGGTRLDYHNRADLDEEPADLAVGFRHRWGGSLARGVVYSSGYLALYNVTMPGAFLSFAEEEVLEYTTGADLAREENDQATLGDLAEGEGEA